MNRAWNIKWCVGVAAVFQACASVPTQLYSGPTLGRDEVALLQFDDSGRAKVFAVDGERVKGSAWYLAPGRHLIWARIRASGGQLRLRFKVVGYCLLRIDAAPGGTYTLLPSISKEVTAGAIRMDVGVEIVDQTDLVVAEAAPCLGGRPSLD